MVKLETPAHLRPCVLFSVALSVVLLHLVEKLFVVHLGHPRVSDKDDSVRLHINRATLITSGIARQVQESVHMDFRAHVDVRFR